MNDMSVLPPNKEMCDKYYLGFYDGEKLIAVMDFIMAYPDELTAFIGFFYDGCVHTEYWNREQDYQ